MQNALQSKDSFPEEQANDTRSYDPLQEGKSDLGLVAKTLPPASGHHVQQEQYTAHIVVVVPESILQEDSSD